MKSYNINIHFTKSIVKFFFIKKCWHEMKRRGREDTRKFQLIGKDGTL